jgi:ankyrin repeat protein
MLTTIIPDCSLKQRTYKQIVQSGSIVDFYCLIGNVKFARLLLAYGADPNLQDRSGRTALHLAAEHSGNSCSLVKQFLHHGSAVDVRNNEGWTPLHETANRGHLECMEQLVGYGADVNALTDDGISALHIAELQKHRDCVTWLLDIGAYRNNATCQWTLKNYLGMQLNTAYNLQWLFRQKVQYLQIRDLVMSLVRT